MCELGRRIRMLTKKLTARHFRSLGCTSFTTTQQVIWPR